MYEQVTLIEASVIYQIKLDNLNKRKDDLCAESLFHLAHNGTHVLDTSPKQYMLVCTDGFVTILEVRNV